MNETIERLNELHAISVSEQYSYPDRVIANGELLRIIQRQWPAIADELTQLREFEAKMRAIAIDNAGTWPAIIHDALKNLDRKRGKHASLQADLQQ